MSNQAEFHATNTKRSDSADAGGPNAAASSNHPSATPNVRHIPIFVEGRDEPLINRNHHDSPTATSNSTHSTTTKQRPTSGPSPNPFDWSRKFSTMGGQQSSAAPSGPAQQPQQQSTRSDSPHRSIPVSHSAPPSAHHQHSSTTSRQHPYAHSQSDERITTDNTHLQHQKQQQSAPTNNFQNAASPQLKQPSQPPKAAEPQYAQPMSGAPDVSFSKITQIQCEVLELMDQVSNDYVFIFSQQAVSCVYNWQ